MAKYVRAQVGDKEIRCLTCDGEVFREREVKLNSTGMELFNMAWANESATGLICRSCGFVQLFADGSPNLRRADA
jgi:predicted nucleic-acid-binding Zn-ribbon protein